MVFTREDLEKARRQGPIPDPVEALKGYLRRRPERLAKEEAERRLKRERARGGDVGDFDECLTELERQPN